MKGGRVEFLMPKARITLQPETARIDVHVWWACVAMATFLGGLSLGGHLERKNAAPCRPLALNEGMVVAPSGAAMCTYLPSPTPRKGKQT